VTRFFLVTPTPRARCYRVSTEDERQLIARLRQGDSAALDSIYALHRVRVLSYLTRMLGERVLAEDLLQETFLRLCRFAPQLRPDTELCPWLLTVARNLCRSHFRRTALDRARERELTTHEPAGPISPFDALTGVELERRLSYALSQLPFEQRELLVLLGVEGLPSETVATLLAISPEALRQRLSRARKQLALLLQPVRPRKAMDTGGDT
jgi:RNA polymerase sigma factor (sigma-70 family)